MFGGEAGKGVTTNSLSETDALRFSMAGRIRKAYNLQCEAATNKREQQGQGVGCQESSFFANKDSRLSFFLA